MHLHWIYSFSDECQNKYGNANAWRYCTKVFDLLTVAAVSRIPYPYSFLIKCYSTILCGGPAKKFWIWLVCTNLVAKWYQPSHRLRNLYLNCKQKTMTSLSNLNWVMKIGDTYIYLINPGMLAMEALVIIIFISPALSYCITCKQCLIHLCVLYVQLIVQPWTHTKTDSAEIHMWCKLRTCVSFTWGHYHSAGEIRIKW